MFLACLVRVVDRFGGDVALSRMICIVEKVRVRTLHIANADMMIRHRRRSMPVWIELKRCIAELMASCLGMLGDTVCLCPDGDRWAARTSNVVRKTSLAIQAPIRSSQGRKCSTFDSAIIRVSRCLPNLVSWTPTDWVVNEIRTAEQASSLDKRVADMSLVCLRPHMSTERVRPPNSLGRERQGAGG